jgi:FtsP/CotA-like multicopper oxidase with cupredoxin domain
MALVAQSGTPIDVSYTNHLPERYPDWIPVDTRLTPRGNHVRLMTHLHGGFVAADSDGNPVVTPDGFGRGETQHVHYGNEHRQMPASLRWFHDHAYLIRDARDTGTEPNPIGVPGGAYEIPLVIQDRLFSPDGKFRYPVSDIPGVTWIGEYFGDHMLVNGKVWPYLDVEPRMYRFRVLNGCNARITSLTFGGLPMWQIGSEGGLFDGPVPVHAAAYQTAPGGPAGVPGGIDPWPFATGPMQLPAPEERGFKDTVKVNPGTFATIRAKFDLPEGVTGPQSYVHHCHIVEHEDNDMMRPFTVTP